MKYPKAFRNALLAHFEKTKKTTWTTGEVTMKIQEIWWDLPKRTAPVPKKRPRKSKADRAVSLKPELDTGRIPTDDGTKL